MGLSKRHHYLPRFYIKGFLNENNLLYVYNKKNNEIYNKPIGSKSIFWEENTNTLNFNGEESSVLEDKLFGLLDNKYSKKISMYRNSTDYNELFSKENYADLIIFIVSLFWRIPHSRLLILSSIISADISFITEDNRDIKDPVLEKLYKLDQNVYKMGKINMFYETLLNLTIRQTPKKNQDKIDFHRDCLLLGDYPMVYKNEPSSLDDLYYHDYILPISSTRLFYCTEKELILSREDFCKLINLAVIHQSSRYIVSASIENLQAMVALYLELKSLNKLDEELSKIF